MHICIHIGEYIQDTLVVFLHSLCVFQERKKILLECFFSLTSDSSMISYHNTAYGHLSHFHYFKYKRVKDNETYEHCNTQYIEYAQNTNRCITMRNAAQCPQELSKKETQSL